MQASGEMRIGEAMSASWAVSRVYGVGFWTMLFFCLAVLLGMLAATTVASIMLPRAVADLLVIPLGIVAWFGGMVGFARWRRARMEAALKARGMSMSAPVSLAIEPEALLMDSSHGHTSLRWSAVTELLQTKLHWAFVAGGMGYVVPRRFFARAEDERAFIKAALERMSEAARGRSAKAMALVAWE